MFRISCSCLLAGLSLAAQTPIAPAKRTQLFNGKNLDGWYTYLRDNKHEDPKRVFRVERGELVVTGEEWGGIGTKEAYRDYHLVAEWRWGGPAHGSRAKAARDSGILVHGSGPDGAAGGVWLASIESQIIEGGTGDILPVAGKTRPSITAETRVGPDGQLYWQRGGKAETRDRGRINWFGRDVNWKDTLNYRGPRDVEKPMGKWNRHEVICAGGRVTNIINGVVVSEGYDAKPAEGRIMIQSEGAEIRFRKIELRPVRKGR
jgi:hypothetical protein